MEDRLAARLPGHAADVAVVAGCSVPGVVIQVLRELASADARQPMSPSRRPAYAPPLSAVRFSWCLKYCLEYNLYLDGNLIF